MRILVVGDIHGQHEKLSKALEEFDKNGHDYIVQLGDLVDSLVRSDEDMLRTVKIAVEAKQKYGNRYIQLLGNHDNQYMNFPKFRCSGFRDHLQPSLTYLLQKHKRCFQVAFQVENYLFTHAGVNRMWFQKHFDKLQFYADYFGIPFNDFSKLSEILNAVEESKDREILHEVGEKRGGLRYDYGGITWCDKDEVMDYEPIHGLHQVVGHTPQNYVRKAVAFGDGIVIRNTSVTFCDVLNLTEDFYNLNL